MVRVLVLFVALLVMAVFTLLNWPAFVAPTPLSLGFTTVQAPLPMLLLGAFVFISVWFVVWALQLQGKAMLEARRLSKDLRRSANWPTRPRPRASPSCRVSSPRSWRGSTSRGWMRGRR